MEGEMSIVSWDHKYAYNNWRPSGAEDSFVVNKDTSADADAFSLRLDGTAPAPDATVGTTDQDFALVIYNGAAVMDVDWTIARYYDVDAESDRFGLAESTDSLYGHTGGAGVSRDGASLFETSTPDGAGGLTIKILNSPSAGDADAFIDERYTFEWEEIRVDTPTDGFDYLGSYQPDVDAASTNHLGMNLEWVQDYSPLVGVSSSLELFLI
jgi:hypothetical protein